MDKIVYISPLNIAGINAITKLANYDSFLEHLDPIDFHYILFSTLYQSGANHFEVSKNIIPPALLENPFWKDKFIMQNEKVYIESFAKAYKVLENNFNIELDQKYRAPQHFNLVNYFSSLFYSVETGVPFINAEFSEARNFDHLETRLSKELFVAIKNLYGQIQQDSVSTITPQYSMLKKDVKRFEEIANSTVFLKYSDSLNHLTETNKIDLVKRDIEVKAMKVYNKYGKHLDLRSMTFSFLKFTKKVGDLFVNKPTSILGDYIVEMLEKTTSAKKSISYYNIEEAHYMIMWGKRLEELVRTKGRDALDSFMKELENENNR